MPTQNKRVLALGMALLVAGVLSWLRIAETTVKAADASFTTDNLQRSWQLDNYKVVADQGAGRGENIYFYKCWMCHNQYTKSAPLLKDLYQRKTLVGGAAVNDDTVAAKIKDGGAAMPAFKFSLSDADVADVVAYFHSGKCCVEGENPPANPYYKSETTKWPVPSGLNA